MIDRSVGNLDADDLVLGVQINRQELFGVGFLQRPGKFQQFAGAGYFPAVVGEVCFPNPCGFDAVCV